MSLPPQSHKGSLLVKVDLGTGGGLRFRGKRGMPEGSSGSYSSQFGNFYRGCFQFYIFSSRSTPTSSPSRLGWPLRESTTLKWVVSGRVGDRYVSTYPLGSSPTLEVRWNSLRCSRRWSFFTASTHRRLWCALH